MKCLKVETETHSIHIVIQHWERRASLRQKTSNLDIFSSTNLVIGHPLHLSFFLISKRNWVKGNISIWYAKLLSKCARAPQRLVIN